MALLALLRIAIVNNARARFPYFPVAIWLQGNVNLHRTDE